jgi:DNA topoisomerase-1
MHPPAQQFHPHPAAAARGAGLRYVNDAQPGIHRVRAGKGFAYRGPEGGTLHDKSALRRIKSLAIPPAWTDVWICPRPDGHVQATGRDDRGRKQYRYHPDWRRVRDGGKYGRMIAFARALPHIRARTERDLALPGLPRDKVLATVVRLLETTLIRVGNDEYARHNRSFGLTTMRDRHVRINGTSVRFTFRGKGGVKHAIDVQNRRLARIVRRCRDLPGYELFQYLDDGGEVRDVKSDDVNVYLREIAGEEFTAKDFRTWAGTVLAACALQEFEAFDSKAQAKRNIVCAIEAVARRLGNTTAVCRKCYVHPAVLDAYLDGSLVHTLKQRVEGEMRKGLSRLRPEEAAVLALLQERLKREEQRRGGAVK